MARSEGKTATWSFVFTGKPGSRPASTWSYGEYDHVKRVAVCNLPDVKGIEKKMAKRLSESDSKKGRAFALEKSRYQIHTIRHEPERSQDEPVVQPMGGCSGWYCGVYVITIATQNGRLLSIHTDCREWVYFYECNSGGGGGDGDGDSCPDPTMPCDSDGNLPDPCVWLMESPAWMCGDPCDTENATLDDPNVQQAMHEAWEQSYGIENDPLLHGQRNEAMYMVTATSSGYEFEEIPPGPETSSCTFEAAIGSLPSNIVALIHTHPYGDGDQIEDPRCPSGEYIGDSVSVKDRDLVQDIKDNPGLPPIPMYVIDKDKIRVIEPSNPSQYTQTINRCGY